MKKIIYLLVVFAITSCGSSIGEIKKVKKLAFIGKSVSTKVVKVDAKGKETATKTGDKKTSYDKLNPAIATFYSKVFNAIGSEFTKRGITTIQAEDYRGIVALKVVSTSSLFKSKYTTNMATPSPYIPYLYENSAKFFSEETKTDGVLAVRLKIVKVKDPIIKNTAYGIKAHIRLINKGGSTVMDEEFMVQTEPEINLDSFKSSGLELIKELLTSDKSKEEIEKLIPELAKKVKFRIDEGFVKK